MNFTLHETLYFFDEPLLWTMVDRDNTLWASTLLTTDEILCCPTEDFIIRDVLANTLPARALFDTAALHHGTWAWLDDERGHLTSITLRQEEECSQDLPTPGVYLQR